MEKILNILLDKRFLPITLIAIIFLLLVFNIRTCDKLRNEKDKHKETIKLHENNIKAMADSLIVYFDEKLGVVISEKTSFLVDKIDDLEKYNKELYDEVSKVNNLVTAIHSDVTVKLPKLISGITIVLPNPEIEDGYSIEWEFNYKDEGLTHDLKGRSDFMLIDCKPDFSKSILLENNLQLGLKYNVTETDGAYTVKAYSLSEYVTFNDLESVVIRKQQPQITTKHSKWFIGPTFGFGLNSNLSGDEFNLGWFMGVGVGYNFLK